MTFKGRFHEHMIPDQLQMLNVSFQVPNVRQSFGGCGANIAYNLKLLGSQGYLMGTVGSDFSRYAAWMDQHLIERRYVLEVEDHLTAAAYIISDLDDNQITAFHPGAMEVCHLGKVPTDAGITIGVISPEGREGMLAHASQFSDAGIPYLFDPGQGTIMFNGTELFHFIERADWLACNEYESSLIVERTGFSIEQLAERAGIIHGLQNDMDWQTLGRVASLMGAIKIESNGTQRHYFTRAEFDERFSDSFSYAL